MRYGTQAFYVLYIHSWRANCCVASLIGKVQSMATLTRTAEGYTVSEADKVIYLRKNNRKFDVIAGDGFDFNDISGLSYAEAKDRANKLFRQSFRSPAKAPSVPAHAIRGNAGTNPLADAAAALRSGDLRAAADALDKAARS